MKPLENIKFNKKSVALSFSNAAASYDNAANLQQQVGNKLLTFLPKIKANMILDLGCGTGFFSSNLKREYPLSQILGLDLAEGMVAYASKHHSVGAWLCGDAEELPLIDKSVDVKYPLVVT